LKIYHVYLTPEGMKELKERTNLNSYGFCDLDERGLVLCESLQQDTPFLLMRAFVPDETDRNEPEIFEVQIPYHYVSCIVLKDIGKRPGFVTKPDKPREGGEEPPF